MDPQLDHVAWVLADDDVGGGLADLRVYCLVAVVVGVEGEVLHVLLSGHVVVRPVAGVPAVVGKSLGVAGSRLAQLLGQLLHRELDVHVVLRSIDQAAHALSEERGLLAIGLQLFLLENLGDRELRNSTSALW
eukprot:6119223-Alexandrium_andersonii.AAC.1